MSVKQTALVATLTSPPDGTTLAELPAGVAYLEVRADLLGDQDVDHLRASFPGQLIYTLRSKAEGGAFEGGKLARRRRLLAAAEAGYDLIDIEVDRDHHTDLLAAVPPSRRLVSWHGPATHLTGLKRRFAQLAAVEARFHKLIPTAGQSGDGVRALALLQGLGRDDAIVFAAGALGTWTRMVAPYLGSPLTYGALGEQPGAPGQLTLARLCRDFGLPALPPIDYLCGIVGKPVLHSLSPRLHNGAYRALGLPALYVPFHVDSFADFWLDVVEAESLGALGLPLKGLSITAPHKEVALAVSGASSPRAQHISAANTLVLHDQVWEAETTDPEGVTEPLRRRGMALKGRRAAIVGCGGAGKASAYGLQLAGAAVTLVNRGHERGRRAATELHLPWVPLADFDPAAYDLVVNATPLGRGGDDPLPFAVDALGADAVVFDLVYGDAETPLAAAARGRGLTVFEGREALLFQALGQFQLITGKTLDEDLARRLLGLEHTR